MTPDELNAALALIERGLKRGFHAKVFCRTAACPFTNDLCLLASVLTGLEPETVTFAAPPTRKGDRYAARGYITFSWGHGPEDVVGDFSDNFYVRQIVGVPGDA